MSSPEQKTYRKALKRYKRDRRRSARPFGALTKVSGIFTVLLAIALLVFTLFDQTFFLLFKSEFYNVKHSSSSSQEDTFRYTSSRTDEERRDHGAEVCEQVEGEGAVLLKNDNNALPLKADSNVSCFSHSSVDPVFGGTGSGATDASSAIDLKTALENAGFRVNETLWDFYTNADGYGRTSKSIHGSGAYAVKDVPWSEYSTDVLNSIASYGDAAIITLSRIGGEGSDLPVDDCETMEDGSALSLTDEEKEMLVQIGALKQNGTIKKVIVLLNSANALQLDFLNNADYGIDACLWIGDVGQTGLNAVGKILSGEIVPSGHLAETFLNDTLSSPAMQNFGSQTYGNADSVTLEARGKNSWNYTVYAEGIYVGYRYYETRYEDTVMGTGNTTGYDYNADVAYPFGYGLSYTDFAYSDFSASYDAANDVYNVTVTVTNTGSTYSGKQVVQVYAQSPYTEYDQQNHVEKSAVTLCGFGKTSILAPGESETLTVQVDRRDLASYDAYGAKTYILDAGDYYLTVAENAHAAVNNILTAKGYTGDSVGNTSMVYGWTETSFDAKTYSTSASGAEITNQFDNADLNLYDNGQQGYTALSRSDWTNTFPTTIQLNITEQMASDLADVQYGATGDSTGMPTTNAKNGRTLAEYIGKDFDDPEWDELLDQMSFDEMAELVGRSFHRTAPAASVGLPGTHDENGPNGLTGRLMKSKLDVTSFPSEDIMAATWNKELIAEIGTCIGEDCLANGYSGLYGPGANLHRTPYGGRNFEYYSEDPYLSGEVCTAEVQALNENGVYVFIKHCALNEGETNREGIGTWANEQSIRELYLKAFQKPLETVETAGVMNSYTRIGCTWNGAHKGMLTNVLRNEWNNKGAYISDNTTFNTYMSGIDGVLAGTTMFDSMAGIQYRAISRTNGTDAALVNALREACHYDLYVIANSSAMNGIGVNDAITLNTPGWLTGLRVACAGFAVLWGISLVMGTRRRRAFDKTHEKPQKPTIKA